MSALDPSDPLDLSQSLDEVLNLYTYLYGKSKLSVCIRNNDRETIYSNKSFSELFERNGVDSKESISELARTELELSKIELELFYLGAETAMCKNLTLFDVQYQVRLEIRYCDGQFISIWFINELIELVTFKCLSAFNTKIKFNAEFFLSGLSPKCFNTMLFVLLGFNAASIAKIMNISEKATNKRISRVKSSMNTKGISFDDFRLSCLNQGVYSKIIQSTIDFLNVKSM